MCFKKTNKYFQLKERIEINNKSWDIFKKYTYPYEYVHSNVDGTYLSKYRPLSRAFYKMTEIIHFFNLINIRQDIPISTYHFAEGPGGFIEAIDYNRNNIHDTYYGVTLIDNDDNSIPGWKKSKHLFETKSHIHLNRGVTYDGDIYKVKNLDYIYENHRNKHDIVTCDGGTDFNNQESMALKLILCETIYGIVSTKLEGHFILKLFDLFTTCSYEIVYFLSQIFEEVYICKPNTSRYGNSEKYLICKYKKIEINNEMFNNIKRFFIGINVYKGDFKDLGFIKGDIPYYFMNQITELNIIFVERQIDNINSTLSLIINNRKKDIIETYKKKHINLCVNWLKQHNIPYNYYKKENLFLSYK